MPRGIYQRKNQANLKQKGPRLTKDGKPYAPWGSNRKQLVEVNDGSKPVDGANKTPQRLAPDITVSSARIKAAANNIDNNVALLAEKAAITMESVNSYIEAVIKKMG